MTFDYTNLRQRLNQHPQTAGNEQYAHDLVVEHLQQLHPDHVYTRVGGWGVVAVWGNNANAPTVALRADTDALPSGHRCGHDGHTTIMLRVAELVDQHRPSGHNVLLLWQPAEETGQGAAAIVESGVLAPYNITRFYALHNLPGYDVGQVVLCANTFAAASVGLSIELVGRQTHASTPEMGLNPGLAVSDIIKLMQQMNRPMEEVGNEEFVQATLICVRLGEPAFGTSAGHAELMFTLRAFTNATMQKLLGNTLQLVEDVATQHGLQWRHMLHEPFVATENTPALVDEVERTATQVELPTVRLQSPMRWSEDFGIFLQHYPGAMFGIGSGRQQPELHHPDYDFPDTLVEPAARLMEALCK